MRRKKFLLLSATFALVAVFGTRADVIYQAVSPTGVLSFTQEEEGDEVQAAGSARIVTQMQIGVSMQGSPGTADFVLRLYSNNGPAGAPGSLLWGSSTFSHVSLSGPTQLISFNVPDVVVPDVFTWTLQISNESPLAAGLAAANPPSIGSSPPYIWFGGPGIWTKSSLPQDFMVSVTAVPEPSSWALLCLGAVAFRFSLARSRPLKAVRAD